MSTTDSNLKETVSPSELTPAESSHEVPADTPTEPTPKKSRSLLIAVVVLIIAVAVTVADHRSRKGVVSVGKRIVLARFFFVKVAFTNVVRIELQVGLHGGHLVQKLKSLSQSISPIGNVGLAVSITTGTGSSAGGETGCSGTSQKERR